MLSNIYYLSIENILNIILLYNMWVPITHLRLIQNFFKKFMLQIKLISFNLRILTLSSYIIMIGEYLMTLYCD